MAARTATNDDPDIDALKSQIADLRTDLSELGATMKTLASARAAEAKSDARDAAAALGAKGRETLSSAADAARGLEADCAQHVRDKPLQSLAIAAGLGLALGYLTRPR